MTMTDTVLHLDPKTLQPDPDNPRITLRDMDPFTESIRQVGVREPLTIRYLEDGTAMVVKGHRRLAGALAAPVATVPCILENEDDAKDPGQLALLRLIENVQRDDFNVAEEARAIQQCLDLGMDETTIAGKLAVDKERITEAATVAKSEVAVAAADRFALGFDEALAIAEFESNREAVKLLTVTAIDKPDEWDHLLERLRQERDEDATLKAARTEWAEAGYEVLDHVPAWQDPTHASLNYLARSEKATSTLTPKQHEKCPGRAVTLRINRDGGVAVMHYCKGWKDNGHFHQLESPSSSTRTGVAPGQPKPEKTDKEKAEEALHRNAMKAGRAAQEVRRQFVRDLLKRKSVPAGMLEVATLGIMAHHLDEREKMFRDLTGLEPIKEGSFSYNATGAQAEFLAKVGNRCAIALFARLATHVEYHWETNSWRLPKGGQRDLREAYLKFLQKTGYSASVVEHVFLGDANPSAITKEADALKAAKA